MTRRLLLAMLPGLLAPLVAPLVQRATASEPVAVKVAEAPVDRCDGTRWAAAWRAAPQGSSLDAARGGGVVRSFTDRTLRMVLAPSRGGEALRVHLGNRHGPAPVRITAASIGVQADGASVVPGTLRPLTFDDARGTTIATGATATSDPIELDVRPLERLVVSFAVAGDAALDHHQWATTTSYASVPGDHTGTASAAPFTEALGSWYGIAGVDVLAPRDVGTIVTIGDSITDGVGSTIDADRRWPDLLARRFDATGIPFTVVNAGIGGNHVVTSATTAPEAVGPSVLERLGDDALSVPGVTDVLVYAGINDVFTSSADEDVVGDVIDGYEAIARQARASGVRVIGATITPASLSPEKEARRVAINEWIRTGGAFDEVVDLDAAVRDPSMPSRLRPEWDAGFAHLNDAGYAALAAAVPLGVFRGTGC